MLITVSRQYGAGGTEIARRVATELRWRLVDNEVVERVAARAGLPPEEVAQREERTPTFLERLARVAALELPDLFVPGPGVLELDETRLLRITETVCCELAAEGCIVLVGRAAAAVLARERDVLHLRVVAPRDFRIRTACQLLGIDAATAERELERTDADRARYHREYYGRDWNDPLLYDLVLNAERLGLDGAAALIAARARALGW